MTEPYSHAGHVYCVFFIAFDDEYEEEQAVLEKICRYEEDAKDYIRAKPMALFNDYKIEEWSVL